jgi:putative OmpL-like beta-barrel porin-2
MALQAKGKSLSSLSAVRPFLAMVRFAPWLLLAVLCAVQLNAQGAAETPMPADRGSTQATASDPPQATIPPESQLSPSPTLQGGFFKRFYNAYAQELNENGTEEPEPVNLYGDLYFPKVAQGLNIRFGRYISLPDIEAQLAPQNYMYSHSLLYSYDPFTQTGVITTWKLDNAWLMNLGISAGNDIAPWAKGDPVGA